MKRLVRKYLLLESVLAFSAIVSLTAVLDKPETARASSITQASSGTGCDLFTYTSICLEDNFPNGIPAAPGTFVMGSLGWACSSGGAGLCQLTANETNWDGGYHLNTIVGAGSDAILFLRNGTEAANEAWNNLATLSSWKIDWLFRTPDGSATGATYRMGLRSTLISDVFTVRWIQGTDTNWTIERRNGGGAITTTCAGSEAPSATNYYIFEITGAGSTTLTTHLFKSTANYAGAQTGTDILSACTATISTPTYGFVPIYQVIAAGSDPVSLNIHGFRAKFTF